MISVIDVSTAPQPANESEMDAIVLFTEKGPVDPSPETVVVKDQLLYRPGDVVRFKFTSTGYIEPFYKKGIWYEGTFQYTDSDRITLLAHVDDAARRVVSLTHAGVFCDWIIIESNISKDTVLERVTTMINDQRLALLDKYISDSKEIDTTFESIKNLYQLSETNEQS